MLARAAPRGLIVLVTTVAALALVAAYLLARFALGRVAAAMADRGPRLVLAALAGIVILLFGVQQLPGRVSTGVTFADPVTPAYVRQARYALAMAAPGAGPPPPGSSPTLDSNLRALHGADVLLIFVESYGAVTYEMPAIAAGLAASRADLTAAVRDTGRHVVSAYVESPTFGGSS